MTKTALRAACVSVAVATAFSAIVGVAGPASADRVIHRDARHDVMKVVFDETGTDDLVRAPRVREGDVTRAMIDHRYRRVVIKLRYAELTRSTQHIEIAELRTSNKALFGLVLFGFDGQDQVRLIGREDSRCKGLWSEVDYRENTIKLSVPRRCLDNPEWVRVGVGYITMTRTKIFLDDALSSRVRDNLTMTRRLYRN